MSGLISMNEVADMMGVTHRRAQALVETNLLPAIRIGHRYAIDPADVDHYLRVRQIGAGQPMTAANAWEHIESFRRAPLDESHLDRFRRHVRPRADHQPWFVHPSIKRHLRSNPDRLVLSGSDAAVEHNVPVGGPNDLMHLYVSQVNTDHLREICQPAIMTATKANLIAHVVPDAAWPFQSGERHAGLNLAWLDMADHDERGTSMVLDAWLRRQQR